MPKVTEEYRVARRHEIAQAALRCFARKGFAATSMADIIAESGLSAGAIYGHFTSKDELMELTASEILDARFLEVAEARAQQPLPAPGEIVRLLVTGLRRTSGHPAARAGLGAGADQPAAEAMSSDIGGRVRAMFTGYLTDWHAQTLRLDEAHASPSGRRPLYIGLVQGYVTQTVLFDDFDGEGYLEVVESLSLPS